MRADQLVVFSVHGRFVIELLAAVRAGDGSIFFLVEVVFRTEAGRTLATTVATTDHAAWWFLGPDRQWWSRKNGHTAKE